MRFTGEKLVCDNLFHSQDVDIVENKRPGSFNDRFMPRIFMLMMILQTMNKFSGLQIKVLKLSLLPLAVRNKGSTVYFLFTHIMSWSKYYKKQIY